MASVSEDDRNRLSGIRLLRNTDSKADPDALSAVPDFTNAATAVSGPVRKSADGGAGKQTARIRSKPPRAKSQLSDQKMPLPAPGAFKP